jgi:uncharacterized protein (TIGR01777 family)
MKSKRRILIAGGTGYIGRSLCRRLLAAGYEPAVLSRRPETVAGIFGDRVRGIAWDGRTAAGWVGDAEGAHGIVNLAGESVGSGRWTTARKERILQSRVDAARAVVDAIARTSEKPKVLIQGSAAGYYADRGDEPIDEDGIRGSGFLAGVVARWEETARGAERHGVRFAVARTAMVLGEGAALLRRLTLPLRLYVGGPVGSGGQWVSWIHIEDEIGAIHFLLEAAHLSGIFNLAAPHPVRNAAMMKALGAAINRPSWLRAPAAAVRLILGELADELVLSGLRVVPKRLLGAGYAFSYPDIASALEEIYA